MRAAARKTLLLSIALVGVLILIVARLALSPFWPRYTPAECSRAYARATTLADTQRVDLIPAFGSNGSKGHHCGEVRASVGSLPP